VAALCVRHSELGVAIRAEAEAMLQAKGARGTAPASHPEPQAPTHIGPFRVLCEIGAGGMGTVYLAEQKAPIQRRVAVKVIKLGMDTKAVLARFEAEHAALSRMEHSNIAKVLDSGSTADGRPYFVMEYVKGVPITRYCDENRLSIEERLALFQQVCSGVQHAHSKGVIHRDLTPNNVLVTVQDGRATARIIDFGLARATDHRLTEKTLFTEQGVILGTPEYMSPEQAGLGGLDVDTRSDVYTLGVMLYELLSGSLPFSGNELRAAGYDGMCRICRERDPERPSTKITRTSNEVAAVAKLRRSGSEKLLRRLRGDLDWIVLRCLEKDRTRRYDTPSALAKNTGEF
jgi:serine/threonine protein kinase